MSTWDKEYAQLCKTILNEGTEVKNRTGVNTIKVPGYFLDFDLKKEYPFLTTKQLYYRLAILEILWIYQVQSNDVRWLQERNVHIWDEWEVSDDGKWYKMKKDANGKKIKTDIVLKDLGKEYAHTIGTAYGYIVNKFKHTDNLINMLKNDKTDRRQVVSLWQDDYLKTAVLPSCVWATEWDVTNNTINAWIHQRSCDVALGLPFNVTQYATLINMMAHVTGLDVGHMYYSIKDAHIYVNHIDKINEQIRRTKELEDYEAPKLWLNPEVKNFYDFDNSKDIKDVKVLEYKHHGPLKFDVVQ